jgi:hypothetical protein
LGGFDFERDCARRLSVRVVANGHKIYGWYSEKLLRKNADTTAHLRDRIATLLQNIGQTPKKRAIAAGFVFSSRARYEFISDDF